MKELEGPKMDQESLNYFSSFSPRDDSYGSKTDIKGQTQIFFEKKKQNCKSYFEVPYIQMFILNLKAKICQIISSPQ